MVTALNRVKHLPRNDKGRDLIVGDLHGHPQRLLEALSRLNFDPLADRVISVGNLINKGPDSMGALKLLEAPWFHSVRGGCEALALAWLTKDPQWGENPLHFLLQGGNWIHRYPEPETRAYIQGLLEQTPLGLIVDHPVEPFRVVHAMWAPVLNEPGLIAPYRAHDVLWNSALAQDAASIAQRAGVDFTRHSFFAKTPTWADVTHSGRITYCGRNSTYGVRLMHHGHLHMNGGLGQPSNSPFAAARMLALADHTVSLHLLSAAPALTL